MIQFYSEIHIKKGERKMERKRKTIRKFKLKKKQWKCNQMSKSIVYIMLCDR